MELLTDTDWEEAFYYAYESHVISDAHEESFGAVTSKLGAYALEFYVDRMLLSEGYCGEVDIEICIELIVTAYTVAFPDSTWQPTVSQIKALYGAWAYQLFWLPYIAEINVQKGYRYYSDYDSFIDASVQEVSLMPAEQ